MNGKTARNIRIQAKILYHGADPIKMPVIIERFKVMEGIHGKVGYRMIPRWKHEYRKMKKQYTKDPQKYFDFYKKEHQERILKQGAKKEGK